MTPGATFVRRESSKQKKLRFFFLTNSFKNKHPFSERIVSLFHTSFHHTTFVSRLGALFSRVSKKATKVINRLATHLCAHPRFLSHRARAVNLASGAIFLFFLLALLRITIQSRGDVRLMIVVSMYMKSRRVMEFLRKFLKPNFPWVFVCEFHPFARFHGI